MAKRCPKCKGEISRYQAFCYQCGEEIKHVSKRPKIDWGIEWKWFLLGMVIPPLGYSWFFFFSGANPSAAVSALKGAIATSCLSFLIWQIYFWFVPVQPIDTEQTIGMIAILFSR